MASGGGIGTVRRATAINAAITTLAIAFAEQGIKDGVQVNSIVPGSVMTGRRQSSMEKWAPAHGMTVEEAIKQFAEKVGIRRCGERRRSPTCSPLWFRLQRN